MPARGFSGYQRILRTGDVVVSGAVVPGLVLGAEVPWSVSGADVLGVVAGVVSGLVVGAVVEVCDLSVAVALSESSRPQEPSRSRAASETTPRARRPAEVFFFVSFMD